MTKKWTTTEDFIQNGKLPSGAAAGLPVSFAGYAEVGDGGLPTAVTTGNVITPSQSPADLGENKLSDARGNELELTLNSVIEFKTFAELEASGLACVGQRLKCRERADAEYIIQPHPYVPIVGDGVLASGLAAKLQITDKVLAMYFGALEDYDPDTDSGTDDYLAILDGLAYLELARGNLTGGTLWITNQALTLQPIVLNQGINLQGLTEPISLIDQVGGPEYPPPSEGSAIIGGGIIGPVVHQAGSSSGVKNLTIGATQARNEAVVSTGVGNINCGLLTETEDTANAIMLSPTVSNVVIRNQPADGHYTNGDVGGYLFEKVTSINCGRHGSVIDSGQLAGRANIARPGFGRIKAPRSVNIGGHGLAVGHPSAGASIPYRVEIENYEGIRCGNTPSYLYRDSGAYIVAEQVNITTSASSGTSGLSGNTPALDHAWAVAGRQIALDQCRYINCLEEFLLIVDHTGIDNDFIQVRGGHGATTVGSRDYFCKVEGSVRELNIEGLTGQYVDAVDLSALSQTYTVVDGQDVLCSANAYRSLDMPIEDDEVTVINFAPGANSGDARGVLLVSGSSVNRFSAQVHFRVGGANHCSLMCSTGTVNTLTAPLAGTTGPDVSLNISAAPDGKLYIENRTGAQARYVLTFLSIDYVEGVPVME